MSSFLRPKWPYSALRQSLPASRDALSLLIWEWQTALAKGGSTLSDDPRALPWLSSNLIGVNRDSREMSPRLGLLAGCDPSRSRLGACEVSPRASMKLMRISRDRYHRREAYRWALWVPESYIEAISLQRGTRAHSRGRCKYCCQDKARG